MLPRSPETRQCSSGTKVPDRDGAAACPETSPPTGAICAVQFPPRSGFLSTSGLPPGTIETMSRHTPSTDSSDAAGTSGSRSVVARMAALFAFVLVALIASLGLVTLEPGDNYCGRVLAPRHESIVACDEALDDQRRTMAVVAAVGAALVMATWVAASRTHPNGNRT